MPPYLLELKQFDAIPQIAAIYAKATLVFTNNTVNKEVIDELRGQLLRTLDDVLQLKATPPTFWGSLTTSLGTFFTKDEQLPRLDRLSAIERQKVESALISTLQKLATQHPLDNVDPIDFGEIEHDEAHLLSLSGRKYRLTTLAWWVQSRQDFIYPDFNKPMFEQDIQQLKQLCQKNGVSIEPPKQYSIEIQHALEQLGLTTNSRLYEKMSG